MFERLVRYIIQNYRTTRKIVEVGVGHRIDIAIMVKLSLPDTEITVTDKDESWVRTRRTKRVRAVADDVMFPNLPIYEGAGLIYSLHPPPELVQALENLAGKVGADLIIVPVSDEQEMLHRENWKRIVVEGRTAGWLSPAGARNKERTV